VTNMNDFVVINEPQRPPSVYKHVTPINALFNRRSANIGEEIVRFADVTVDIGRRKIMRGSEIVKLTRAEYNLLLVFVQNVDRALTRDAILNAAWGYDFYPKTRTVDPHVCRLRHKLESNPATPHHFLTVHGVGYRFLL
jgi:DNA-binding response OmpR family regulator